MRTDPKVTGREPEMENSAGVSTRTPNYPRCGNLSSWSGQNYIDKDFLVEQLTPIVTNEANSRTPIYQMHKWWARRLGSVFRMLLITSFSRIEEKRKDIWTKYVDGWSLKEKIILDPMMGGGTTIVETLKLGGKAIGIDINPVAWFVTKKEIELLDPVEVQKSFQVLESQVGSKIRKFYQTKCSNHHNAEIMYALWHKQIECGKCHSTIAILQDYVISEKEKEMVILCPSCGSIFGKGRNIKRIVTCTTCKHKFNPRIGSSRKGIITCTNCGHKEAMTDAVRRKGGPIDLKLFCIEYYCQECGKQYKKPDSEDTKKYLEAESLFSDLREKLPYPKEIIPDCTGEGRPKNHGYQFFYQLFNSRQLLCLSTLLEGILKIPDRNAREFLLLAFSSCLETNNILCKYETKWQKVSAMFGIPAYHPVERIAENNVWGTRYGRGTFVKCYYKMLRAKTKSGQLKKHANSPTENEESWFTLTAKSFTDLKESGRNALLECMNSESLSFIPDNSIDLVATDPPYFDNLNYSRLADFFYVWLRIGLMKDYVFFRQETSAREKVVVLDGAASRTGDRLAESLTSIFKECHRVLKPNRPMVFTFHHTKDWAWQGLMKAIRSSGFSVVESHFIRSEGRTGFRKSGNISYDVCIVCRKAEEVQTQEKTRLAISRSSKWIRRLVNSGNGLQDSDVHSIVMGNLLTYTPNLVLNGFTDDKWVRSVLEKCLRLKNGLEMERGNLSGHYPEKKEEYIFENMKKQTA